MFRGVNIDMEIPAHPPSPSIGYPITWVAYAFLFSFFLFFFFLQLPLSSENQALRRGAGFVKLPPCKFFQLCIFRLGMCELAESGLPVGALFTFEAIRVRAPEETLICRKRQKG